MKPLAFLCNVILSGFTCLVIFTDGMSVKTDYIVFTIFLLLVPLFNLFVFWRSGLAEGWTGFQGKKKSLDKEKSIGNPSFISPALRIAAVICNVILLGSCIWAFLNQHPHPREEGYIAYLLVVALTPVLSIIAILQGRERKQSRERKRKEEQS